MKSKASKTTKRANATKPPKATKSQQPKPTKSPSPKTTAASKRPKPKASKTSSPKPPSPKTAIFDTTDDALGGAIPGPIRVEVVDDTIWACGGHVSIGRAYRCHEGRWSVTELPFLPNFILAISAIEAIVGGAGGNLTRTVDGGVTWVHERLRARADSGWLICASRDRAGRVWIGAQNGGVWSAPDPRGTFEHIMHFYGSVNTVRQMSATSMLVVTENGAYDLHPERGTLERAVYGVEWEQLIDGAIDDRGGILLVANGGNARFAKDGAKFRKLDLRAKKLDFDAVFFLDGWYVVLGYDGTLRVSLDAKKWTSVVVEPTGTVARLGGFAAYRGGWLVGASRSDSALSGTLSYLGDPANAPFVPAPPPEKAPELSFVIAERYALLWATSWANLPNAEKHSAGWMKLAGTLR